MVASVLGNAMSYDSIPHEMRRFRQWCLWRYEQDGNGDAPTKVPYCGNKQFIGMHANVNDPSTWADYDECIAVLTGQFNTYSGLGFILSENDPYVFIDLDDCKGDNTLYERQLKVYNSFQTYSELSPSGKGLHLIGKGAVPSGRKRSKIEIYSKQRFMTMTGNVYLNVPIKDVQDLSLTLWTQMGKDKGATFYDPKAPQTETDIAIMDMAANAENSAKFLDLYNGNWQQYYPSQSEADQALINILAFYTQNKEQIIRLFQNSELGQRKKANRANYLEYTINKAFDQILPPIDIASTAEVLDMLLKKKEGPGAAATATTGPSGEHSRSREETSASATQEDDNDNSYSGAFNQKSSGTKPLHLQVPPPGLMGQIAEFVYQQAPRQVPEIALVAAIGMMAGICGRSYNVNGTGLNQYVMFLGTTGVGKEGLASGIDKLLVQVQQQVPAVNEFFGPSDIASGQALRRRLEETPCFVSVVGEVDGMIKELSNPNAQSAQIQLKRALLDLYNKSGKGRTGRGTIYSDTEKNVNAVERPSFSMIGEATPQIVFRSLNEEMINSGFLPRWTIIEYTGDRMPLNHKAATAMPSRDLVDKLAQLAEHSLRLNQNNHIVDVEFTNDAWAQMDAFDKTCDRRINQNKDQIVLTQLWNRAHIKALKLAALISIGINPFKPVVDAIAADYAIQLTLHDTNNLIKRFTDGTIGGMASDELVQRREMVKSIYQYLTRPWDEIASYCGNRLYYDMKVIPHCYFSRRVSQLSPYKSDKRGGNAAMKSMINIMIEEGILVEVAQQQRNTQFNSGQKCYAIQNATYIIDRGGQI